ncbi:MAG: hypothetical protein AAF545_05965 [Pseudomonadota bacterium]
MKRIVLILAVMVLAGCGTASTIVLEAPRTQVAYSSVSIVSDNPTVQVPQEVTQTFESELRRVLVDEGPFDSGEGLNLRYTFMQHDEGDRFSRWFWGGLGNSGEASITVQITYTRPDGEEIAKTRVEGRIDSGFFGGSMDSAIKKAAQDVASYTIANFE